MSIRLRLTLVYSAILALTLAGLGGVLYGTQLQSMRADEERLLSAMASRMVERLRTPEAPAEEFRPPPWPEQEERDGGRRFGIPAVYWQISTVDGQVIARSPNLEEVTLPLTDKALDAIGRGATWIESVSLEADRLLVYGAPVVDAGEPAQIVLVVRSLAQQDQYLATMRRNLLVGSGVAVVVAFACGWVLSGLVLRPVDQITHTAQTIGAERDFSRRVQYTGPEDEIGQLATTFNAMLGELEAAFRQQQQFVADVSHELRTPLTTLRGNLELLRRDPPVSEEDRHDVLQDMGEESDRLIRLVNGLLRLARADARQALRSEVVPVVPLAEDVCRQATILDSERSITLGSLPDVAVLADRDGLKQVILILIDNAVKHTMGPITISGEAGRDRVTLRVRDSGPGVGPAVLPYIFKRFYRVEPSLAGAEVGLGLGLAIAKSLVEAQGGTIAVESDVARGSTFSVTLPKAPGETAV